MMGSTTRKVYCRLCLCAVSGENVTLLNGIEKEMLALILPELNFTICSQSSMCKACTDTLKQIYGFKSSCLEVEDKVQGFVNPKTTSFVDLEEIVRKTARCNISGNMSVCRTCLALSEGLNLNKLGNCEGDPLRNMVEKCLPEMGLNITKEPSICSNCLEQLEEQFNFIMQCLDTESKINYYCETKHIFNNVDLHNVYQFSIKMEDSGSYEKQYEEIPVIDKITENGLGKRDMSNTRTMPKLKPEFIVDLTHDISPVKKAHNLDSNDLLYPTNSSTKRHLVMDAEPNEEVTFQMAVNKNGEQIITSETAKIITKDDSESEQSVTDESSLLTVKKIVKTRSSPRRNSDSVKATDHGAKKAKWEFKEDDYQSEDERPEKKKRLITQKCKYCNFKTKYKSRIKAHMTRVHKFEAEEDKTVHQCAHCPFKTEDEKEFQKHKGEHRKERERQNCPHCDATFVRPDFLQKHIASHKNKDTTKSISMPKTIRIKPLGTKEKPSNDHLAITSTMSKARNYRTFMMNGMSFKMFRCNICPYQTRLKSNYLKHVATHKSGSGITVNKCKICNFETIHKENYLTHMESHKNDNVEKVRRCFLCSFQPNTEEELTLHVSKVHKSGSG